MSKAWPMVPLGEVMSLDLDRVPIDVATTYEMVGVYSFGRGLFIREPVSGSETSYKFFYRLKSEHVVMSQLFGWEGALALSAPEFAGRFVSPQFPTFHCHAEKLDRRFLGWCMRRPTFWEDLGSRTKGMGDRRRTLNPEALFLSEIPLPPLSEQRRIVAKIDELAAKIEEARGLRRASTCDLDWLLASSCRGLFESREWPVKTVAEVVGQDSLRNGKSVKSGEHPDGIHCLRLSAMRDGLLDLGDSKPVPLTHYEARPYLINARDVFVLRGNGSKNLVGRAALAEESQDRVIFPDLLIRVPLENSGWLPEFFVSYWNSPLMRSAVALVAKTTSGIWKINQGHIAAFSLPMPPQEEQRRIVAHLDDLQAKVDRLKDIQAKTAAELDALLPSILDKAFKGEL